MMSTSARKLTLNKLAQAFNLAITLLIAISANAAGAQNGSDRAVQVADMVRRVRAASAGQSSLAEAFALGQKLLVEARYGEAYELFAALLEKWPREPEALYGAALAAFNLGRATDAEPLARSASELFLAKGDEHAETKPVGPNDRLRGADALVLLAVIQGARGNNSEALKSVQRAVSLAPENFDAQSTLGRALYSVGDSVAAVRAFRTALKLRPEDAKTLFFLATALENAGDVDGALLSYRELARRRPQSADGHVGLGALLIKRGGSDVAKGIEELRTAVRLDPDQYEAQVTLGRALLTQRLTAESLEHLKRAAELAPGNPEPHYQLALAYRRLGRNEEAVAETAIVKRIHETRRGDGAQNNTVRPNQ